MQDKGASTEIELGGPPFVLTKEEGTDASTETGLIAAAKDMSPSPASGHLLRSCHAKDELPLFFALIFSGFMSAAICQEMS